MKSLETTWLAPPRPTTGLDHLAIRAVSEAFYADLVPCVTNVTDRIYCYALYPWILRSFSERRPGASHEELVEAFRRAECLVTLIGARHEWVAGTESEERSEVHGGGLAGRRKLLPVRDALQDGDLTEVRLSTYATQGKDDPNRYFKAKLGALEQYYLGTLQNLDILGWHSGAKGRGLRLTEVRGLKLAELFATGVPVEQFWFVLEGDLVDLEKLDALSAFCPCSLGNSHAQRELLTDVLLNRDGHAEVPHMRDAVSLLLQLLNHCEKPPEDRRSAVTDFRWAAYAESLPDAEPWRSLARRPWAAYQQHEILGLAVQALFSELFIQYEDRHRHLHTGEEMANWFIGLTRPEMPGELLSSTWEQFTRRVEEAAVPLAQFDHPDHEKELCRFLMEDEATPAQVVEAVLRLLAQLSLRIRRQELYEGFGREPDYFRSYPVNLHTFRRLASETWTTWSLEQVLHWLISHWCVTHSLRVALRKLRAPGVDTFRLRPTEHGLVPVGNIEVVWSSPRLAEALRALQDLGYVDEGLRVTPEGQQLREYLGA